jgi:hypothetical protein
MARRVQQLLERQSAIDEELQQLMPKQYLEPTNDTLGSCWQSSVQATGQACEYLFDLAFDLDYKAREAEKRAKAAQAATDSSPLVDNLLPSQEEHSTGRAGSQ